MYRVTVTPTDDGVVVAARENGQVMSAGVDSNGMGCGAFSYVRPPNFVERILGITYEDKILRKVQRWEVWLGKQTRQSAYFKQVAKKYNNRLRGRGE